MSAGTEGIAARHQAPESKQPRRPIPVVRPRIPVDSTLGDFVFPSARCILQETPRLERLAHDTMLCKPFQPPDRELPKRNLYHGGSKHPSSIPDSIRKHLEREKQCSGPKQTQQVAFDRLKRVSTE